MIQVPISQRKRLVLGALSIAILLGLYTWLSARQHAKNPLDSTIPTWSQLRVGVVQAFTPDMRGDRWIVEDVKATGARLSNFKNELRGCGPFLHDDPRDRPPAVYGGRTTLHLDARHPGWLLLPVIPDREP